MINVLLALLVALAGARLAWQLLRAQPLRHAIKEATPVIDPPFENANTTGFFGEMLTSVLLAQEGWKQLPTHLSGGRGLDGLFLREHKRGGVEVLLTETKTTQVGADRYKPAQMADDYVRRQLGDWGTLFPQYQILATQLIGALDRRSPFLRKVLWQHDLDLGVTLVIPLDAKGEKHPTRARRLDGARHRRLIEALAISGHWFARRYGEPVSASLLAEIDT